MNRRAILLLVGAVVTLAAIFYWQSASSLARPKEQTVIVTLPNQQTVTLQLEVARTPDQIRDGLMFRTTLAENGGMLFLLGSPQAPSFWMKNTLIELDMVFVDSGGKVVKVHSRAQPRDLTPISSDVPVVAVIELRGGRAAELGIDVGAQIQSPLIQAVRQNN